MKSFLLLFVSFLIFTKCGSNNAAQQCKYKAPSPVFQSLDSTSNYSFESNAQSAIESVRFDRLGFSIELVQSGCSLLSQEYRIILPEKYPFNTPADVCAMHISGIFYGLSVKYPLELNLLQSWATAIRSVANGLNYNEALNLPDNSIKMTINKIHDNEKTILSVLFEEF